MDYTLTLHTHFMETALKLARFALDHGETPVACILVDYKLQKIVSFGMNNTNDSLNGISHAEFIAIQKLLAIDPTFNFKSIILYVTVEPCIMCASALKQIGINKIVFGCCNERFGGNGTVLTIQKDNSTLPLADCSIVPGILRKEAILLLRFFYVNENDTAPTPKLKNKRILDKENFPPINWSSYLTEQNFTEFFGISNLVNFISNDDLTEFSTINLQLVQNNHDDILNSLNSSYQEFKNDYNLLKYDTNYIKNKKIKIK